MGEVVSLAEAAERLSPLDGEVVAVAGQAGSLADLPAPGLPFAKGDAVTIYYAPGSRVAEARLYGPTTRDVRLSLCRELVRTRGQLVARPHENRERRDWCWIDAGPGEPDAGAVLAQVRGVTPVQMNLALGQPVLRIELIKGRPSILFDPNRTPPPTLPVETDGDAAPNDTGADDQ